MISPPARLGSFEVGEEIGKGGVGVVYRAVHIRTEVPVAIKMIVDARDRATRAGFQRELQAQARLVHPGVVYLFDYGVIDGQSDGADSPYVVMELARKGSLRDHLPISNWSKLRRILLQILDALAFSHARGVIHRDLKPENILVFEDEEYGRRFKLADFGLAHAVDEESDLDEQTLTRFSGTPHYMPPEQIRSHWRLYGPWTDLYAVGCIAWELVCRRWPFEAPTFFGTVRAHCERDRPALDPHFEVPADLEAWIHRAMAIEPDRRFRCAADAIRALPPDTPESSDDESTQRRPIGAKKTYGRSHESELATVRLEEGAVDPYEAATTIRWSPTEEGLSGEKGKTQTPRVRTPSPASSREVPESWKMVRTEGPPLRLVGTGLGIFGLREVPFVDRNKERDRLWRALHQAARQRSPRVVILSGESGSGKSRLAQWLSTRSHEVGAAVVLQAIHTEGGNGHTEGLPGLVQRFFHTWRLDRSALYQHLLQHLPRLEDDDELRVADAQALCELVDPTDESRIDEVEGPLYQFSSPRQKWAVMNRLLARIACERSVVLWLDDLQWGPEAIDFVEYLLTGAPHDVPVVVVATVRSDLVAEQPNLAERLVELERRSGCEKIGLSALSTEDHRQLVDRMLPLAPDVGDRLATRTEGNPLFAHQLLSHWIDEGYLEVGAEGFRIAHHGSPSIPDDIHELWMNRLERLVDGLPTADAGELLEVIELAATLGREVNDEEWRALCNDAGLPIPDQLVDTLIDHGLARRTDDRWAFAHGLFVDAIRKSARRGRRLENHHRRCAQMLEHHFPDRLHQNAGRRAEHWLQAGEKERALEPLLDEIVRHRATGATGQRRELIRRRRRLLDELDVAANDPQRLENDYHQACEFYQATQIDEAIESCREIFAQSRAERDEGLVAQTHELLALCMRLVDDPEATRHHFQHAIDSAAASGDDGLLGRIYMKIGRDAFRHGDLDRAQRQLDRARELLAGAAKKEDQLRCESFLGWMLLSRGDYDGARQIFDHIGRGARAQGLRTVESYCMNGLGDIARFARQHEEARKLYTRFHSLNIEVDDIHGQICALLNLTQVELDAGEIDRAKQYLDRVKLLVDPRGMGEYREAIDLAGLALASGRGDWSKFDRIFAPYADGWADDHTLFRDHPWLLENAATYAEGADEFGRAERLLRLARLLWNRLGDDDAVQRVEARLTALASGEE